MPSVRPNGPSTHIDPQIYAVTKQDGTEQLACVLNRHDNSAYVHYLNQDKRLDEWVREANIRLADAQHQGTHQLQHPSTLGPLVASDVRKRKRRKVDGQGVPLVGAEAGAATGVESSLLPGIGEEGSASASGTPEPSMGLEELEHGILGIDEEAAVFGESMIPMTEEEYDILHHKQIGARRNFEKVYFGQWEIRTWYWSPYPFTEAEDELLASVGMPGPNMHPGTSTALTLGSGTNTPGTPASGTGDKGHPRKAVTSHSRTSDLLAGSLARGGVGMERGKLYVCEMCFKYMTEPVSWEIHVKKCPLTHPPGRKVYQKGGHIIWEVDGAKAKLYCQNLTLFGKLFIDHKTLYFDIDRFCFYVLTEATSQHEHAMGFFSKEKISYDGNNLACIITFPPYQKKRYGMLMIEFSYELSKRVGELGSPERPLSDLGLKSYLSYWTSTIVRLFRKLLNVIPEKEPGVPLITQGSLPQFDALSTTATTRASAVIPQWKRHKMKGYYGEAELQEATQKAQASTKGPAGYVHGDEELMKMRSFVTVLNPDGSATTKIVVQCTLAELSRATHLKPEDVAFALNECGLVSRKLRAKPTSISVGGVGQGAAVGMGSGSGTMTMTGRVLSGPGVNGSSYVHSQGQGQSQGHGHGQDGGARSQGTEEVDESFVITREAVEAVAKARNVQPVCIMACGNIMLT